LPSTYVKMARLINIRRSNDVFDRYMMPEIDSAILDYGAKSRTDIYNLKKICKSLRVNVILLPKFIQIELRCKVKLHLDEDRCQVFGSYSSEELLNVLRKFIDLYVVCPECGLPETSLEPTKKKIVMDCSACGREQKLVVDHPLSEFIMKNARKSKKISVKKDRFDNDEFIMEKFMKRVEEEAEWHDSRNELDVISKEMEDEKDSNGNFLKELFDGINSATTALEVLLDNLQDITRVFEDDERLLLDSLSDIVLKNESIARSFVLMLKALYDNDVLSEDRIIEWTSTKPNLGIDDDLICSMLERFIQWLSEDDPTA